MAQQKNSGSGCIICILIIIVFVFMFYFAPYMFSPYIYFAPAFPIILILIGIVSLIYVVMDESRKPASYYPRKNYNPTYQYTGSNPVNYVSPIKLRSDHQLNSNDYRLAPTLNPRFCRECGGSIVLEAKFCHNCGTQIYKQDINYSPQIPAIEEKPQEEKTITIEFCPFCGTKPDRDSFYCSQCGTKLD